MELLEINPFVRYVDRRNETAHYASFVMAYDHRLFYVEQGSFVLCTESDSHVVHSGSLVILPPAFKYKIRFCGDCTFFVVNFDIETERQHITEAIEPRPENEYLYNRIISDKRCELFPAFLSCDEHTRMLVEELYTLYYRKSEYSSLMLSGILKLVIAKSFSYMRDTNIPENLKRIKDYIELNYAQDLTNKKLGEMFSYHPNYLNRYFKAYTGKSLHSYMIDYRLSKSVFFLSKDLSINDVCKKCGFASSSYFINKFREKYGESPLQFKKRRKMLTP